MRSQLGLLFFTIAIITSPVAEARHMRTHAVAAPRECNVTMPCDFSGAGSARQSFTGQPFVGQPFANPSFANPSFGRPSSARRSFADARRERFRSAQAAMMPQAVEMRTSQADSRIVGGRPSGCPNSYCGCAASIRVFGHIVPELNLASNWLRFPRAAPAPGMVAARHGHVFVLEQHVDGDTWMAYDGNSGGHATRIHARSLRGYTIVNPRAA